MTTDMGMERSDAPAFDADPRRRHWAWAFLREGREELCDGLTALAAEWRAVEIGHELELSAFASRFWERIDSLLGEHACQIWFALLELRDATPRWRAPALERELSPAAARQIVEALAAVRAAAAAGGEAAWDGSVPEVRARLAELGEALRDIALGRPVADVLEPRLRSAQRQSDLRPADEGASGVPPLTLGQPHTGIVPR